MPMKCIDQMPAPMESDPPASQDRRATPVLRVIRSAIVSPVYEAAMETAIDSATSRGSW